MKLRREKKTRTYESKSEECILCHSKWAVFGDMPRSPIYIACPSAASNNAAALVSLLLLL